MPLGWVYVDRLYRRFLKTYNVIELLTFGHWQHSNWSLLIYPNLNFSDMHYSSYAAIQPDICLFNFRLWILLTKDRLSESLKKMKKNFLQPIVIVYIRGIYFVYMMYTVCIYIWAI